MANLRKCVSVLGVLTFLTLSSHVSGQMTAEAVYETLSYSIFKMKTDMENLKRRFENIEEKGQRISTTSSPQLAGRPLKEEEMLGFKEYLSLQALAIKKTLAAEKLLLRETVGSFEVKFAEFKSEIQKDITSINASFAAFKSEIQKDIASINASLEGKGEAMVDILNRRSSALAKDMTELTSDLNNKTGNINMLLETMERTMMSNIGDIRTRIVNITMMQSKLHHLRIVFYQPSSF
jgi:predicted  nucleic acid-binding Zn-ribbon protein